MFSFFRRRPGRINRRITRVRPSRFNDEKEHYKSLTSLAKWIVSILAAIFTLFGISTYLDGQRLREASEQRTKDLNEEIKEMRAEMKAELKEEKIEFRDTKQELEDKLEKEISQTRQQALSEISSIKIVAKTIAENEAKSKINEVFDRKNIDEYIVRIAMERIENNIYNLVDNRFDKNADETTEHAIVSLESNDKFVQAGGYLYFIQNQYIKLADSQYKRIIQSLSDKPEQQILSQILLTRIHPLSTEHFKNLLLDYDADGIARIFALQYFVVHELEYDFVLDYIYKSVKAGRFTIQEPISSVQSHPKFIAQVLNSTKIVDLQKSKMSVDEFKEFQNSIKSAIGDYIDDNIRNSYFFKSR